MPWEGEREPRPVQYLESESRSKVEERSRLSGEQSFERASERAPWTTTLRFRTEVWTPSWRSSTRKCMGGPRQHPPSPFRGSGPTGPALRKTYRMGREGRIENGAFGLAVAMQCHPTCLARACVRVLTLTASSRFAFCFLRLFLSQSYEDYLDKQITTTDLYYLEDIELARQLVELG